MENHTEKCHNKSIDAKTTEKPKKLLKVVKLPVAFLTEEKSAGELKILPEKNKIDKPNMEERPKTDEQPIIDQKMEEPKTDEQPNGVNKKNDEQSLDQYSKRAKDLMKILDEDSDSSDSFDDSYLEDLGKKSSSVSLVDPYDPRYTRSVQESSCLNQNIQQSQLAKQNLLIEQKSLIEQNPLMEDKSVALVATAVRAQSTKDRENKSKQVQQKEQGEQDLSIEHVFDLLPIWSREHLATDLAWFAGLLKSAYVCPMFYNSLEIHATDFHYMIGQYAIDFFQDLKRFKCSVSLDQMDGLWELDTCIDADDSLNWCKDINTRDFPTDPQLSQDRLSKELWCYSQMLSTAFRRQPRLYNDLKVHFTIFNLVVMQLITLFMNEYFLFKIQHVSFIYSPIEKYLKENENPIMLLYSYKGLKI